MIVKTYSVFCDRCSDWIAETTDGQGAARRIARSAGWKRIHGDDVCPACQRRVDDPFARDLGAKS